MIRAAEPADVPTIAVLIRELAAYEHLEHEVVLDEDGLHGHLFGPRPYAEVLIAEAEGEVGVGVVGSNGRCSIGTNDPSRSTNHSARFRRTSGSCIASPVTQ